MTWRRVIIVAAVLALGSGACATGPDFEVDHDTAAAVKPLSGTGPGPGTFREMWRTALPAGDKPRPAMYEGHLLARTDTGVQAYDPRSGKPTWHYRQPGRDILGMAVSDGVVVINSANDGDRIDSWHTVGLRATTGEILWQNSERWYLTYEDATSIGSTSAPAIAAGGTVVVRPRDDEERLGIDIRTGDELWRASVDDLADEECEPRRASREAGDADLVLIFVRCRFDAGGDSVYILAALDARTGDLRWGRQTTLASKFTMRSGLTLYRQRFDSDRVEVIGRDGTVLFRTPNGSECSMTECALYVSGRHAAVTYDGPDNDDDWPRDEMLTIIDVRNGKTRDVELGDPMVPTAFEVGNGRLYRIQHLTSEDPRRVLMPQALAVVDLASGRVTRTPMPVDSGHVSGQSTRGLRLLGIGGDRLIALHGNAQLDEALELVAFSPLSSKEPLALGGVPPTEWPKPCELLDGLPVDTEHSEPIQPGDPIEVGGARIPATSCRLAMPDRSSATVKVAWVAATEAEADALLDGVASKVPGVDEEGAEPIGGPLSTDTIVRVGRVVVVGAADKDLEGTLETIARNLRK